MAITRINTDQITDLAVTTAKIAAKNITSAKLEDNLSYGSNLTITGNLTVQGTTTAVDSTNLTVEDPILVLNSGASTGTQDTGILIERGSDDSYALIWDESEDKFVFANVGSEDGTTAGNITVGSNADVVMGNLEAAGITISGDLTANAITANTSTTTNTLTVNTTSTFSGDIDLNANIDVSGNAVADALTVNNAGTIGGTLTANALVVNTTATIEGDVTANANATVAGTLDVTGAATFASTAVIEGDVTANANATIAGTANVEGVLTANANVDINANVDTSGDTTTQTLTVNGASTLGGDVDLNANIDVSGDTTTDTLTVNGASTLGGDVDLNANIDVSGDAVAATLTSNGATTTNTLTVNTTSTFGSDVDVNANIDVSGDATTATLTVNGASTLTGDVTASANVAVTGEMAADTVVANTSATLASAAVSDLTEDRLVIAGTAGELEDSGDLTFDGSTFTVGGTAGASIAGATAIEGALTANGTADLNGDITVGANVTIDAGANQITNVADPTAAQAVATKAYVDNQLGSDVKERIEEGNSRVEVHDAVGEDGGAVFISTEINDTVIANVTSSGMTIESGHLIAGNIKIENNTISTDSDSTTLTIDPYPAGSGGSVVIQGNLQVTGTTTTVDSTVVTIADPIFELGDDSSDDNLDRGIKAKYNDGTAKIAFFGMDDSASEFVFISDATDTSSVMTGNLGSAAFGSLRVTDLTDNRVLIGGTNGEIEDSANLTFDGSVLGVTGDVTATGDITGDTLIANTSATLASAAVSDLTQTRIVIAGASGELQDSANLTFSGGALTVTGTADISTSVTTGTLTVNTTSTFGGDIDLNANLDASGSVTADTLVANTSATLASAAVSDLTSGRVVLAGTSGELEDNAGLTYDGSDLSVTGNVAATGEVSGATLDITGASTLGGDVDLNANIDVSGDAVAATLTSNGATTTNTLTVNTTSTLGGDIDLNANLDASGSVTADTLVANTSATVEALTVNTTSTLSGDVDLNANIDVSGDVVASTLTVNGASTLGGDVDVNGNIDVSGDTTTNTLEVNTTSTFGGDIDLNANLDASGSVTADTLVANTSATLEALTVTTTSTLGGDVDLNANIDVSGDTTTNTLTVNGAATINGDIDLNANIDVNGDVVADTLTANTSATLASAAVSDLTSGRVVLAGTSGELEDDAGLTYDGSDLSITGNAKVSADVEVSSQIIIGDVLANIAADASLHIASTDSMILPNGTTAQRPGTAVEGMMRYNSSIDDVEIYDGSDWATLGSEFTLIQSETFTGDGSTTAFTLQDEYTTASVIVSINGVVQIPTTAYAVSNTTLTFTEAPANGDTVEVRELTTTTTVQAIQNGSASKVVANTSNVEVEVGGNVVATFTSAGLELDTAANSIAKADTSVTISDPGTPGEIKFTADGTHVATFTDQGLIPTVDSDGTTGFDLGSASKAWRDVYVSSGSLYVNGQKVLESNPDSDIIITADQDQTLKVQSKGTGDIEFSATGTGTVQFKSDITMAAGVSLVSADANPVDFTNGVKGGNVAISGNQITNANTDQNLNLSGNGTGIVSVNDDMTVSGNLTVQGTTTTIESTNSLINDALIVLANGTSGSPANDSGFVIERGSSSNVAMVWDESADEFALVTTPEDGTTTGDITISSYANLQVATLTGTATQAEYADLAEMYAADAEYAPGTVVVFGGDAEVTADAKDADRKIAGVVSTNPAHLMNSAMEADHTVAVALTGRVPVKVTGTIAKGDMLVAAGNGVARAEADPKMGSVIGKALENFDGAEGVIEVVVGRL